MMIGMEYLNAFIVITSKRIAGVREKIVDIVEGLNALFFLQKKPPNIGGLKRVR
jgi:hypothetical protein